MKTELLIQLDGLIKSKNERVFLLAASNLPWDLDAALLRRLEKRIIVPLPSLEARHMMVKYHLQPGPVHPAGVQAGGGRSSEEIDFEEIAGQLEGCSGSDIRLVCKESAMRPLRRLMDQIDSIEASVSGSVNGGIKSIANQIKYKGIPKESLPGLQ
jgi:katanin p60 ATPase-containing subunit A1